MRGGCPRWTGSRQLHRVRVKPCCDRLAVGGEFAVEPANDGDADRPIADRPGTDQSYLDCLGPQQSP